jgi:hypothetical protein
MAGVVFPPSVWTDWASERFGVKAMLDFDLENVPRYQTNCRGEMPCLVLTSNTQDANRLSNIAIGDVARLPVELSAVRDGLQRNGLLLPLGWRETPMATDTFPDFIASDDWEEDDDVVDDDDDEDEDEDEDEDDDDFFPDDADEFEEEDDDDDEDEEDD